VTAAVTHERWGVAQIAETSYWSSLATSTDEFVRVLLEKATIARWIDRNVPERAKAGDVVELGIGPLGIGCGHFLSPPPAGELVGVEPIPLLDVDDVDAPEPLRAAALACRSMRYRQVRAPGEETGLPEGAFTLAISYNVLDHVRDPAAFLREAHRILAPGGVLVLGCDTVSMATRLRYDLYLKRRHAGELGVRAHTFRFSVSRLESLVRKSGLRVRVLEELPLRPVRELVGRSQRILLTAERQD
jgi:SAM-dependent methyltransferase